METDEGGTIEVETNHATGARTITITGNRVVFYLVKKWNVFNRQMTIREDWWEISDDPKYDEYERLRDFVPSLRNMQLNPGMIIVVVGRGNGQKLGATIFQIGRGPRGYLRVDKHIQVGFLDSIEENEWDVVLHDTITVWRPDHK